MQRPNHFTLSPSWPGNASRTVPARCRSRSAQKSYLHGHAAGATALTTDPARSEDR